MVDSSFWTVFFHFSMACKFLVKADTMCHVKRPEVNRSLVVDSMFIWLGIRLCLLVVTVACVRGKNFF